MYTVLIYHTTSIFFIKISIVLPPPPPLQAMDEAFKNEAANIEQQLQDKEVAMTAVGGGGELWRDAESCVRRVG